MITKLKIIGGMEYFSSNESFSIHIDTLIMENDEIISKSRHTTAFVPGEINKVIEYIGAQHKNFITFINSIWTEEVIKKYQQSLVKLNEKYKSQI